MNTPNIDALTEAKKVFLDRLERFLSAPGMNWTCERKDNHVILKACCTTIGTYQIDTTADALVDDVNAAVEKFRSSAYADQHFPVVNGGDNPVIYDKVRNTPAYQDLLKEGWRIKHQLNELQRMLQCIPQDGPSKKVYLQTTLVIEATPDELIEMQISSTKGEEILNRKLQNKEVTFTGGFYSPEHLGTFVAPDEWPHTDISYNW